MSTYVIAEIGINHNGSLTHAKTLIKLAKKIGFDTVKFQKRTPEITTPKVKAYTIRKTHWGKNTYLNNKNKLEKVLIFTRRVPFKKESTQKLAGGLMAFGWFIYDVNYNGKPTIDWI